jgi:hypothetical protein
MACRVMIDDLHHDMDAGARCEAGVFATTDVQWSAREHIFNHGAALLARAHAAPSPPDGATA